MVPISLDRCLLVCITCRPIFIRRWYISFISVVSWNQPFSATNELGANEKELKWLLTNIYPVRYFLCDEQVFQSTVIHHSSPFSMIKSSLSGYTTYMQFLLMPFDQETFVLFASYVLHLPSYPFKRDLHVHLMEFIHTPTIYRAWSRDQRAGHNYLVKFPSYLDLLRRFAL